MKAPENLALSVHERQSDTWAKIKRYLEDRLTTLRAQNDGEMFETQRNKHIGRIAEVKMLLDLGKERP